MQDNVHDFCEIISSTPQGNFFGNPNGENFSPQGGLSTKKAHGNGG